MALACAWLLALLAAPRAEAGTLHWSAPQLVDHHTPFANPYSFYGISCPSPALCVGIERDGRIATSRDPGAALPRWPVAQVDRTFAPAPDAGESPTLADLTGVDCRSVRSCVAVDDAGHLLRTTDPTGPASAWTFERIDTTDPRLSGVACPSASLCVAVDESGDVVVSRDANARRPTWSVHQVDPGETTASAIYGGRFTGVACPSTRMCIALDRDGSIVTSADPDAVPPTWRSVHLNDAQALAFSLFGGPSGGISCPTTSFCTIASGTVVVTSRHPLGPASTWTVAQIAPLPEFLNAVDCPDSASCIAADSLGDVYTSTDPSGGAGAWMRKSVEPATGPRPGIAGVSCPTVRVCVAADLGGNVLYTGDPAGPATGWALRTLNQGYNTVKAMSCPSASLCVGYDDAGNIMASGGHLSRASGWHVYHLDSALTSLSCLSATFCYGLDSSGVVLTTADPLGGAGAWTQTQVDKSDPLDSLSCASSQFCVGVTAAGDAAGTLAPSGGAADWRIVSHVDPTSGDECGKYGPGEDCAPGLDDISCPVFGFCEATDLDGAVLTANSGAPWTVKELQLGSTYPAQVNCVSATFCVYAGQYSGQLFAFSAPAGGTASWRQVADDGTPLTGVSCASVSLCVAYDSTGGVVAARHPGAGAPAWARTNIDGNESLTVNCAAGGLCIATDPVGNAFTAGDPAAGVRGWHRVHVDRSPLTAATCPSAGLCVAGDTFGAITVGSA